MKIIKTDRKMKILIADDSELVRGRIKESLKDIKEVEIVGEARNGIEALKIINETNPDLVILDLQMPELNGIGVLKKMKENKSKSKVCVLTNYPYVQYEKKCREEGAEYFFDKNADFQKVKNMIAGFSKKLSKTKALLLVILFSFLLFGQTSYYADATAKNITADTSLFKYDNITYKDIHDYSKPYNFKDISQGKNIASDLLLKYGDNVLAMVAGYFQGKGEAYRVTIEYGGPLTKTYSMNQLSSRWHSFAVYKTSFQIGTAFTIFLSGRNDFWRGAIQSATCLSLNNLISDGVYNNAKGFSWFRQSNQTGWALEKTLTPGVKLGILTALVALRIIYEVWISPEE